jgi:hypothetical protein
MEMRQSDTSTGILDSARHFAIERSLGATDLDAAFGRQVSAARAAHQLPLIDPKSKYGYPHRLLTRSTTSS